MKERVIIVLIAIIIGLTVTTLGFFIYQSTKMLPNDEKQNISIKSPTPTAGSVNNIHLLIEEPKNEAVTNKRTIQVKGKTNSENTIIVSTNQEDVIANPSSDGSFSVSITIDAGTNKLMIKSISPNGEEKTEERTITFSTEDF